MPGKHHLRGFKIAKKNRLAATMVSIALVDARKTSLMGVQNSKKIGSPLRGSWTMVSIALVDARKTSLMGVQNSKKIGSPLRGSWTMLRIVVGSNPPPWKKARSAPLCMHVCMYGMYVCMYVCRYVYMHVHCIVYSIFSPCLNFCCFINLFYRASSSIVEKNI